jgi:hypothetical protein
MSAATNNRAKWVASLQDHRDIIVWSLAADYFRDKPKLRLCDVERLGRQVGAVMVRAPLMTANQWRLEAIVRVLEAWLWGTGRKAA